MRGYENVYWTSRSAETQQPFTVLSLNDRDFLGHYLRNRNRNIHALALNERTRWVHRTECGCPLAEQMTIYLWQLMAFCSMANTYWDYFNTTVKR